MIDIRSKQEAELMKEVRTAYEKVVSLSPETPIEEMEHIKGVANSAWGILVGIGADKLERIHPGTKHNLKTTSEVEGEGLGIGFLKLYQEIMPQVWEIRNYRRVKELSDKIPGEI